jgi:uncharacterized membrane protein YoaT (DUF817 family)
MANRFTSVEAGIDQAAHGVLAKMPRGRFADGLVEFLVFGLKQAWACLFGGLMLAMILVTRLWWPDIGLYRYDFWFLAALSIQLGMIVFRLETLDEARIILIFHFVGTGMEIFKTAMGSWAYPDPALLRIAGVPLFSGFMYACVGSYMVRIQRIFDISFTRYPPVWMTALLALAIYINFFGHHYSYDMRWVLFGITIVLYGRSWMHYRVFRFTHRMPMLLAFFLVALFIWIAENIATWGRAWIYPGQEHGWAMVSWSKLGSWYLLMLISVVLVTLVHKPRRHERIVDAPLFRHDTAGLAPAARHPRG